MAIKPYCEKCCIYFNNKSNLNAHNKTRHDGTEFVFGYKCPECEKVYKAKRNVKPHFLKNHSSSQQDWETAFQRIETIQTPNQNFHRCVVTQHTLACTAARFHMGCASQQQHFAESDSLSSDLLQVSFDVAQKTRWMVSIPPQTRSEVKTEIVTVPEFSADANSESLTVPELISDGESKSLTVPDLIADANSEGSTVPELIADANFECVAGDIFTLTFELMEQYMSLSQFI